MGTNSYLEDFERLIIFGVNRLSYKFAWARAIVEIISSRTLNEQLLAIELEEIAIKIMEYYWDEISFYESNQSSQKNMKPSLVTYVEEMINFYKQQSNNTRPISFRNIKSEILMSIVEMYIDKFIEILKKDVSYRFLYLEGNVYTHIYNYIKGNEVIHFKPEVAETIKINSNELLDLIKFEWIKFIKVNVN